ncbi:MULTISPECIES: acetolactate synthase small subunit [Clostridium]|uniref:acetolactate synthase small subunit n=1 Tax=Clostridium TaxID=1485 RepID=UPI00069E1A96|nr:MULTISPECIES: acetolactate synthase small subunit [Clostridium]KOF56491.1 acetolactate synthase [Clostridium sp. DMHC 10]MCD2346966.1 acetolactate synthase small subunit [Clostridium guangxiense]
MNSVENVIIELVVVNHPGVMSHITGLFARRAFNLEGILCSRIGTGEESCMYLLVKNDDKLEQIVKQLEKLYDICKVTVHGDYNAHVFDDIQKLMKK